MSDPANVFRRLADEVINGGRLSAIDELVAPDYVDHTGGGDGPSGYRETLEFVRASFSIMHMTVHDTLSEGDRVAARFVVSATHTGEFMGIAPTGKQVTWEGIGIIRVADGKMAERWNVSDMLGLLEQIQGEAS
jgi:predicted ester cyclase